MPQPLHGIVPALLTPFQRDERIDYNVWQVLIDTLVRAGVDGMFVGGSSGEFYALDLEERTVSLRFCRQAIGQRVRMYANVGCITTRDTIALAQQAEGIGVDAVAVVAPYYLKPSQQELAQHYIDVCRSVHIPVLAYNFPQHGGVEIAPATLAAIASQCENLVGIKDSSGRMDLTMAYRESFRDREPAVFVGPEDLLLPALERRLSGCITACANIAPKLFVDLYRAHRDRRADEAREMHELVCQLSSTNAWHTFPSVMKLAMEMIGMPIGSCRRPIGEPPPGVREKLKSVLEKLREAGYLPHANSVVA